MFDPSAPYPHPYPPAFPPEVMSGPRLQLPDREYLLFEARLDELRDMVIHRELPWGGHEPALFWPEDRAWFVATDIDLVVTLVGGSSELVHDLVVDRALNVGEVSPIQPLAPDWTD